MACDELRVIATRELRGKLLDWAASRAMGQFVEVWDGNLYIPGQSDARWGTPAYFADRPVWCPSTDWAQCGDLIDRFGVALSPLMGRRWSAVTWENGVRVQGDTACEAACRAVALAKLGEQTEVPVAIEERLL